LALPYEYIVYAHTYIYPQIGFRRLRSSQQQQQQYQQKLQQQFNKSQTASNRNRNRIVSNYIRYVY